MLDKLRVCIICNYYSLNGRLNVNEYINHPEIARLKCEHLDAVITDTIAHRYSNDPNQPMTSKSLLENSNSNDMNNENCSSDTETEQKDMASENSDSGEPSQQYATAIVKEDLTGHNDYLNQFNKQFNLKIGVGNVSKYLNSKVASTASNTGASSSSILHQKTNQTLMMNEDESIKSSIESSQYNQDLITHKWMIYIRSPNCPKLENYIKKVVFYLHFSYKPYDLVEVK